MVQNPPIGSRKTFGIINFVPYDYVSNISCNNNNNDIAGRLQEHLIALTFQITTARILT